MLKQVTRKYKTPKYSGLIVFCQNWVHSNTDHLKVCSSRNPRAPRIKRPHFNFKHLSWQDSTSLHRPSQIHRKPSYLSTTDLAKSRSLLFAEPWLAHLCLSNSGPFLWTDGGRHHSISHAVLGLKPGSRPQQGTCQ